MLKFIAESSDGTRIVGIGLSRENCDRLLAHQPIELDLKRDYNLPFRARIVIVADQTEQDLAHSLRSVITPETVVRHEPVEPAEPVKYWASGMTLEIDVGDADGVPVVFIDFGETIKRIGLHAHEARAMAAALIQTAEKLEAQTGRG